MVSQAFLWATAFIEQLIKYESYVHTPGDYFREICRSDRGAGNAVINLIKPLADGYLRTCKAKKPVERDMTEFFGLRDFYRYDCCNYQKIIKSNVIAKLIDCTI